MDVTITELCSLPPDCVADTITSDGHVIAFCDCRFTGDGAAVWWAQRGATVFRVERATS